jgi:hypothetical protein
MKRKINGRGKAALQIVLLLVLCEPIITLASDITFSSSGTITDGNVFDTVYVQNDGTVVDMTGGQIGNLQTSYVSTFNLRGGQISKILQTDPAPIIDIGPTATLNILGGSVDIGNFVLGGESYTLIQGGQVSADLMKAYYDCVIDIEGGILQIGSFSIVGSSQLPTINIYGSGFDYDPTGGTYEGILTGYLADGSQFSINDVSESEYLRFNLVPEPGTLLLFSFGGLFLARRR